MGETIDEIWEGDLLGRKAEAELLIGYVESVTTLLPYKEDSKAFTIAVDAGYGEGKTWFLKRLARQLAINHPVAFVDAWQDDLADEPLTALVATLKKALTEHFPLQTKLKSKFDMVVEKSGKLVKLAAKGATKRVLSLAFTTGAVDAAENVLSTASEEMREAINDSLKDVSHDTVNGAVSALTFVDPADLMKDRIADFEAGQKAIADLKSSLADVVASLDRTKIHPPIVIIIDELDRCRPTYALKLLEEIKHLFDVPGLVFVLGMHGQQLAHSVSAAYGSSFNGNAYLSRFIGKRYSLSRLSQEKFIDHLMLQLSITADRLSSPNVEVRSGSGKIAASKIVASYADAFCLGPRDTIKLLEALQVCLALTGNAGLFVPLLVPLIVQSFRDGHNLEFANSYNQIIFDLKAENSAQWQKMNFKNIYEQSLYFIELSKTDFDKEMNKSDNNAVAGWLFYLLSSHNINYDDLACPLNYKRLVETVGRFSNPSLQE